MMENKHGKHHGGNSFILGVIIGALLATLLTTKRGRQILRDITDLGLEMFEQFVDDKTRGKDIKIEQNPLDEEIEAAGEDLAAEITESEVTESSAEPIKKTNGNGNHNKRLFRGIKRK